MLTLTDVTDALAAKNLNQKQLAVLCGCSEPTISTNLRGGKRRPDAKIVQAMAKALDLPFDQLLDALTIRPGAKRGQGAQ